MEKTTKDPDKFLSALAEPRRSEMVKLDKEISKIMKGKPRVLWSGVFWGGSEQDIIGYGDLKYERRGKTVEWFLVGLALQKNYISIYVNAVEDNKYLGQKYGKELGKVKIGASSVSFKNLDDLNLPNLLKMIEQAKNYRP